MNVQNPPRAEETPRKLKRSKSQGTHRVRFEIEAPPGSQVFVAGSFNDWNPSTHRLTDKGHPGKFRRNVNVKPGAIEYKFLIDAEWQIDSNCTRWTPNCFGSLNSVVEL